MSLQKLIHSIEREAQAEAEQILNQAQGEAQQIRQQANDQAQAEAKQLEQVHVKRCRKEAEQHLSQARLQARNRILNVRQELVDAVFNQALCVLRTMNGDQYRAWMKRQILRLYQSDEETVDVSATDRKRLTTDWLKEINQALEDEGRTYRVRLEYTADGLDGGFLLRHPQYDVDMSFSALLEELKTQKRAEVAAALFEADHADVLDHGF